MASNTDIQNLYIAYFKRPADVAGLAYWTSGAQANYTAVQIAQLFSQQPEYANAFADLTTAQTVNTLYKNLFNHNADIDGLAYWVAQIDNRTFTVGQVAIAILGGATGSDAASVAAKYSAASSFTNKMAINASLQTAYTRENSNNAFGIAKAWLAGVVDASSGESASATLEATFAAMTKLPEVTLLASADQTTLGTAGDDIFRATDTALLTSGTSIVGNGGNDVLNLITPITGKEHLARVSGVPTLNLQQSGDMYSIGSAFLNQFTTINDYGTAAEGGLYLGTVKQTANLYQTSGYRSVTLNGPNQSVNQVTASSGSVAIFTKIAYLSGASINLNNAVGQDNSLMISGEGTATLDPAQTRNINKIRLNDSVDLTLSPNVNLSVDISGANITLTSQTNKQIAVRPWQSNQTLNLKGTADYVVNPFLSATINATGTAGSLKVLGSGSTLSITSSVPTTVDTFYKSMYLVAGTGNFTITNLGQYYDSGISQFGVANGTMTVNTTGSYAAAFYETVGNGIVTVNLSGSGILALSTAGHQTTTVNAVAGVNASLYLSGSGNLTVNAATSGNLTVTGYAALETFNLAISGGGIDQISVGASNLRYLDIGLVTINNFKASGADVLHTGLKASSMGTINIAASDFSNLASNLASSTGSMAIGSAFIVNIASGAAAGKYVYEHITGTTVNPLDIIVKLTGATGNITAADLLF
ncbi:DUF4214 domain-containing protein [Undibacterium sp. Di26W]|uniref:DUF4214 domain-containing protein n=1 Tax=Undibacterium sp. Di26W TaxID=3413035 RepID=UPI003BF33EF0